VIPEDVKQRVFAALSAGRYSLLLGAGFSATSQNEKNEPLPVGNTLSKEIAKEFDLPDSYPLAQIADSVEPDELHSFLISRFSGCKASPEARLISSFVWRSIYSLNIDDVLHDCYSIDESLQKPLFLSFKDPFQRPEDPEELVITHLHGSVRKPQHGFVFSTPEYGHTGAGGYAWFNVLADELTEQPFIIIGCSLAEPDIETHLARRKGIPSETHQTAPSLFVTKKMDKVLQRSCDRFGLIPIESEGDAFLSYIAAATRPRKRPLELLGIKANFRSILGKAGVEERSLRVFFRQWLPVDESQLPEALDPVPLLAGAEPMWQAIKDGEDVIRESVTRLMNAIDLWQKTPQTSVVVLQSAAGEGKSTTLYRVALELSKLQSNVFFFAAKERLVDEDAAKVISHLDCPAVLVIDNISDHAPQVTALLDALNHRKVPCFVLGASRRARLAHFETICSAYSPQRADLKGLTSPEALGLIQKLRAAGRLGGNAGIPDGELAKRITSRQLIASIVEASEDISQFDALIQSELGILSEEGQEIYQLVALAHSVGLPIKLSILIRASKLETRIFFPVLHGELRGIVHYVSQEYVETRHRVVSEHIVRCAEESVRYELLVNLVSAIAPYVNRKTVMRGTVEARLGARLMDFDDCIKPFLGKLSDAFYEQVRHEWEWNSRYWEQRALLAVSRDVGQAITWARHAVGIERHPHTLTTLAKILFQSAEQATSYNEIERAVTDALQAVDDAISSSALRKRSEIHPFDVAVRGIKKAMKNFASLGDRPFPSNFVDHIEVIMEIAKNELSFSQTKVLRSMLDGSDH
jgi:hypothetical protein